MLNLPPTVHEPVNTENVFSHTMLQVKHKTHKLSYKIPTHMQAHTPSWAKLPCSGNAIMILSLISLTTLASYLTHQLHEHQNKR